MENVRPIGQDEIIRRDWRKIIIIALGVVLIAVIITLFQPFLYRSSLSVYVVQKSGFSIDAYSAAKSEERLATKLAQLVYSSTFFEKVANSEFNIDRNYFPIDEQKKREKWNRTIEANVPAGLSRLDISLYHTDPKQSLALAKAVGSILLNNKNEFIGISDVDLRILDTPLVSKYPVRPNIILNLLGSMIIGLLFGLAYVLLFYKQERDKLFAIPGNPKLIKYKDVPEPILAQVAVEEMVEQVPEIEEIEQIEEIDLIERSKQKAQEIAEQENNRSELILAKDRLDSSEFLPEIPDLAQEMDKVKEFVDEKARNKKMDLPDFSEEDQITAMPEK
ncbi:MAG: hypothetical protein WCT18_04265 [Patescibacteria group bacterium]